MRIAPRFLQLPADQSPVFRYTEYSAEDRTGGDPRENPLPFVIERCENRRRRRRRTHTQSNLLLNPVHFRFAHYVLLRALDGIDANGVSILHRFFNESFQPSAISIELTAEC
jgi:hypothetical protein